MFHCLIPGQAGTPFAAACTTSIRGESDFLKEFWTTEEIVGEQRTDVPIFLLTSEITFSAAEMFAYDLQVRNRATLVGDSTGGGAHSVGLYQIDDLFEIYVPTERAINPVTSGNWEGAGVIPDVVVPSETAWTRQLFWRGRQPRTMALQGNRVSERLSIVRKSCWMTRRPCTEMA